MWSAHCTVLKTMPTSARLADLRGGYQLFRENRTGLYYLTGYSGPPGRYPDFAGAFDMKPAHRIDVAALKAALFAPNDQFDIARGDVGLALIESATSLSRQLEVPLLACEVDDDGYGMTVLADRGEVRRVRFKTSLRTNSDDPPLVDVVFTPGGTLALADSQSDEIGGLVGLAIADAFGVSGVSLYELTEEKLAKRAFKRVRSAAPQLTLLEKLASPVIKIGTAISSPFIMIGMMVFVLFYSGKRTNPEISPTGLFILGVLTLALPVAAVIMLLR